MTQVTGRGGARYRVEDHPLNDRGGQGVLHVCHDAAGRTRVYKRYRAPVTDPAEIRRVTDLAGIGADVVRRAEAAGGRGELAISAESSVNWPVDVVPGPGGSLAGTVLPLIPDSFMRAARGGREPRTLDFMLARVQDAPPAAVRVGVLIRMCDIFDHLDSRRLVHGDVSWKNVVWRRTDTHAYLIDCDGLRPRAPLPASAPHTPQWSDPRLGLGAVTAHDHYSDRYALALAVYRVLLMYTAGPDWRGAGAGRRWVPAADFPPGLDPRLRKLFGRAFDNPNATGDRPAPHEWRTALTEAFISGNSFDAGALWAVDAHANRNQGTRFQAPGGRARSGQPPPPLAPKPPAPKPLAPRRPVPNPGRRARAAARRSRTSGAVRISAAVAVLAVLVAGGLFLRHRQAAASQPEAAPPTGPAAAAPCPAAVAGTFAADQRAGAVLVRHYADSVHDITLCRTADGAVIYHGGWLDPAKTDSVNLPATGLPGGGWRAANPPYLYTIQDGWVTVAEHGRVVKRYRITESSP